MRLLERMEGRTLFDFFSTSKISAALELKRLLFLSGDYKEWVVF